MNEEIEFKKWGKIARLNRDILVTEKLDGTNAHVNIIPQELFDAADEPLYKDQLIWGEGELGRFYILAGSRKRYLSNGQDNYSFWKWVSANADDLTTLGPGRHYGEWWGQGIQRKYNMKEKVFSLFNVVRYSREAGTLPKCCDVVPVLYKGMFSEGAIIDALEDLRSSGSMAVEYYDVLPFDKPEGIVIFHTHGNHLFKVTLEKDEAHKFMIKEGK